MSRAFVKESRQGSPAEGLPERQISEHTNYVTPTGLRRLQEKVGELEEQRLLLRVAVDADDALAEEQLEYVDRDLRYFTARLGRALCSWTSRSSPGGWSSSAPPCSVREGGGTQRRFAIVGEDEADPKVGKISYVSPLAEALLDARVGATVVWRRPAGSRELTIEAIDYLEE